MGFFYDYKNQLIEKMNLFFDDIKIIDEFTPDKRKYPLKEDLVCVGYKKIKNNNSSTGYIGEDEKGEIFSTSATATIVFDIYVPTFLGGSHCYKIFSRLCDFFILNSGVFRGDDLASNSINFDSLMEAFHLKAEVDIKTSVNYYQDADGIFKEIIVKKEGGYY